MSSSLGRSTSQVQDILCAEVWVFCYHLVRIKDVPQANFGENFVDYFFFCVCVLMWKDIQQLKMAMFFGSKIGQTIVPIYFYQTWSCNLERLQTNKFFFNLKTLKDCRWISFSLIWKPRDSFITENCARLPLEGGVVRPVGPQNEQPMKVNSNDEDGWF